MNEDALFDEAAFSERLRRAYACYGKGFARRFMHIYGAPRRAVARLFTAAALGALRGT